MQEAGSAGQVGTAHLPPCQAFHAYVSSSLRSRPRTEQSCGRLSGLRSKPCQAHPKIRRAHGVGGRAQACDGAWCSVAAEGVRSSPRAGGGAVESSRQVRPSRSSPTTTTTTTTTGILTGSRYRELVRVTRPACNLIGNPGVTLVTLVT